MLNGLNKTTKESVHCILRTSDYTVVLLKGWGVIQDWDGDSLEGLSPRKKSERKQASSMRCKNFNSNWVVFSQSEKSLEIHSAKFFCHVVLTNSFRMSNEWWACCCLLLRGPVGSASLWNNIQTMEPIKSVRTYWMNSTPCFYKAHYHWIAHTASR